MKGSNSQAHCDFSFEPRSRRGGLLTKRKLYFANKAFLFASAPPPPPFPKTARNPPRLASGSRGEAGERNTRSGREKHAKRERETRGSLVVVNLLHLSPPSRSGTRGAAAAGESCPRWPSVGGFAAAPPAAHSCQRRRRSSLLAAFSCSALLCARTCQRANE